MRREEKILPGGERRGSCQEAKGEEPTRRKELQSPDHPGGSVTMSRLFLLLLLHGLARGTQGLSLCGWRTQTGGANILRYRGSSGEDTVTVVDTAEALVVLSPLLPSGNITLQELAGRYVFCVHWVLALRIFNFTYGVTKSWIVPAGTQTRGHLSQEAPPSYTCNTNYMLINVTINGQAERTSCNYSFPLQYTDTDSENVEHEISQVADYLDKEHFSGNGRVLRSWLDTVLSKVEFSEDRQYFGKGSLRAAVYKLHSAEVLSSLPDRLGISLSFPNQLLETVDRGARLHVVRLADSGTLFPDAANSTVVGSQVVGVTLEGRLVANLSEDIVITFHHQPLQVNSSPVCVFWDELSESWRTDGCRTERSEERTDCRCNHLTYFALLMRMSSEVIPEVHLVTLSVLTFAGCSISAVSCFFTIIWICCSSKMQSNPTLQIHVNLLGAVLLLDVTFIVSAVVGALEERSLCTSSAAALHFALLCTFSWMAIEGLNLYRLVVKVFPASSFTTVKLALVGWGLPIIIVAAVVLMYQESYGVYRVSVERPSVHNSTASICWLTDPIVHLVLTVTFCAAILLFNLCMMVAMTRRVLRLSAHTRAEKVRHCVTLLGLSCMLGLPWCLAFFSFGALFLPVQYLFSILNSLQGLFIFLWYCTLAQPSARSQSHSSDCSSATPASPRTEQSLSSDHKKLLG